MQLSDFHFELPDELIARFPTEERTASRLLVVNAVSGAVHHNQFTDLLDKVQTNDCLIFNNTRVLAARLLGHRDSGGKVEVLVERLLDNHQLLAQVKSSNALKNGTQILIEQQPVLQVVEREGTFYRLQSVGSKSLASLLEEHGHMPLPPYIDRADEALDQARYQTVYASKDGAVAAPTAGLHFSEDFLNQLKQKRVGYDFVTLHVGSGTFSPIRSEQIEQHTMHSERFELPPSVVELIQQTRQNGGRVIAVGTTSLRCLEGAFQAQGQLQATLGETDIFIYPGYEFKVVDALITNFHLPDSTLILLVSAFAGKALTLSAYQAAIEHQYRFFSYGDAMFIEQRGV